MSVSTTPASKNFIRFSVISLSCAAYSGLFAMPLWLGGLADKFDLDPSVPGYMGSVQLLFAMLSALFASTRINQLNLGTLAAIGIAFIVLANTLSAVLSDISLLFYARALSGLGEGLLLVSLNAAISRTKTPDKYFALSQTTIALFGIFLFALAPTAMLQWGTAGIFFLVALVGLLAFSGSKAIASLSAPTASKQKEKNNLGRYLAPLVALGVLFIGCQGAWAYMERMGIAKSFNIQEIGGFFIIGQLISLLGPISANKFAQWRNRKMAITVGLCISGAATLLASQSINDDSFIAAAVMFQFGTLFIVTSFYGFLAAIDSTGRAVSAAPAFLNFGSAIGPATMAGAISFGGYPALGWTVVITYLIAVVLLIASKISPS